MTLFVSDCSSNSCALELNMFSIILLNYMQKLK